MADAHDPPNATAERFEITPEGIYIDGHRLPATDEVSVEHIAPDFHIVSLKLYAKNFEATEHHRVSKTAAAAYRYVHDATGEET